jgi:hypothetical protein
MAKGRREIASLGEFGLIDHLTSDFKPECKSTIKGVGDDAAVIEASRDKAIVVSTDSMLEGIDFDLTYFPPKHLGYKAVTKGISDIVAMNAVITISCSKFFTIRIPLLVKQYLLFSSTIGTSRTIRVKPNVSSNCERRSARSTCAW